MSSRHIHSVWTRQRVVSQKRSEFNNFLCRYLCCGLFFTIFSPVWHFIVMKCIVFFSGTWLCWRNYRFSASCLIVLDYRTFSTCGCKVYWTFLGVFDSEWSASSSRSGVCLFHLLSVECIGGWEHHCTDVLSRPVCSVHVCSVWVRCCQLCDTREHKHTPVWWPFFGWTWVG